MGNPDTYMSHIERLAARAIMLTRTECEKKFGHAKLVRKRKKFMFFCVNSAHSLSRKFYLK